MRNIDVIGKLWVIIEWRRFWSEMSRVKIEIRKLMSRGGGGKRRWKEFVRRLFEGVGRKLEREKKSPLGRVEKEALRRGN